MKNDDGVIVNFDHTADSRAKNARLMKRIIKGKFQKNTSEQHQNYKTNQSSLNRGNIQAKNSNNDMKVSFKSDKLGKGFTFSKQGSQFEKKSLFNQFVSMVGLKQKNDEEDEDEDEIYRMYEI
jgi:hypothetical protein